jgi:hypothetical protein
LESIADGLFEAFDRSERKIESGRYDFRVIWQIDGYGLIA